MRKLFILLGLLVSMALQSQTVLYPGTRIFTGELQIATGAQFNFKGNYIVSIQTGDTIATIEAMRILLGNYLLKSDTAQLVATKYGLALKLNRTDTVSLVATKYDLTQKLGINATAANSNLLQGKDSTYIKANWGTPKDSIAKQINDSLNNVVRVESDPIWISDSATYISKSQARKNINDTINNLVKIAFDTTKSQLTTKTGQISWNQTDGTFDFRVYDGCTVQAFQEIPIRVQNQTGSLIPNGKIVYTYSAGGEIARIRLADNRYAIPAYSTIGETTTDIPHGGTGYVTRLGKVHDISNAGYESQNFYLGTDGNKIYTKPTNGHLLRLGWVYYGHSSNGIDYVDIRQESATNFSILNNNVTKRVDIDTIHGITFTSIDTANFTDSSAITKKYFRDQLNAHAPTIDTISKIETRYHAVSTYFSKSDSLSGTGNLLITKNRPIFSNRRLFLGNGDSALYIAPSSAIATIVVGSGGNRITGNGSTNGVNNTLVGYQAGVTGRTISDDTYIGCFAGQLSTTGKKNTAIGSFAYRQGTTAQNNTALGYVSLTSTTTGSSNTAIGSQSLVSNTTGIGNTALGVISGYYGNFTSSTLIGYYAGYGTSGKGLNQTEQIKIGLRAGYTDTTNYTLYIDNGTTGTWQTPLIGGRFDLDRVSINKLMPACGDSTLNIGGGIDARGGNFSANIKTTSIQSGTGDDTTSILKDGTINQNYNGVKVFSTKTNGYIYNQMPLISLFRAADTTIAITQNIWYKIGAVTQKKNIGCIVQRDSVQLPSGGFTILWTTSFGGLNNENWQTAIFKNSVLEAPRQQRYTSSSDVGNMTCPVFVESDGDDWFSFKVQNITDNDDITIKYLSIIIQTEYLNP